MPQRRARQYTRSPGETVHTDPRREAEITRDLVRQGYDRSHAAATAKDWTRGAHDASRDSNAEPASVSKRLDEQLGDVPITYTPTPSINPNDPRTSGAGYDPQSQRMRVLWGDGGVAYDYFNVTPQEWESFKDANSPGRWINAIGNSKEYGPVS